MTLCWCSSESPLLDIPNVTDEHITCMEKYKKITYNENQMLSFISTLSLSGFVEAAMTAPKTSSEYCFN